MAVKQSKVAAQLCISGIITFRADPVNFHGRGAPQHRHGKVSGPLDRPAREAQHPATAASAALCIALQGQEHGHPPDSQASCEGVVAMFSPLQRYKSAAEAAFTIVGVVLHVHGERDVHPSPRSVHAQVLGSVDYLHLVECTGKQEHSGWAIIMQRHVGAPPPKKKNIYIYISRWPQRTRAGHVHRRGGSACPLTALHERVAIY